MLSGGEIVLSEFEEPRGPACSWSHPHLASCAQSTGELGVRDDWSWVQVLTWPFIYREA